MKNIFKFYLLVFFLIFNLNSNHIYAKKIVGKAAIIIDYSTQEVLFESNADTLNYPA